MSYFFYNVLNDFECLQSTNFLYNKLGFKNVQITRFAYLREINDNSIKEIILFFFYYIEMDQGTLWERLGWRRTNERTRARWPELYLERKLHPRDKPRPLTSRYVVENLIILKILKSRQNQWIYLKNFLMWIFKEFVSPTTVTCANRRIRGWIVNLKASNAMQSRVLVSKINE